MNDIHATALIDAITKLRLAITDSAAETNRLGNIRAMAVIAATLESTSDVTTGNPVVRAAGIMEETRKFLTP